jgi:hypothetical protein
LRRRFDEILLVGAFVRDEQAAVWALEPLVAGRGTAQELGFEALVTVRTNDLVGAAVLGGGLRHPTKVSLSP